ncbi:MAG TPA: hypothetical protein PK250_07535 [Syntrophobacter fumaroxidans]|nr:hypothetical protein [Syntrophobacter fumaroxidans]
MNEQSVETKKPIECIEAIKKLPAEIESCGKARKSVDCGTKFEKKHDSRGNAVSDAAEAMSALNGYCKNRACSKKNKSEVYSLKDKLIKELFTAGYCTKAYLYQRHFAGKICHWCEGSGDSSLFSDGMHSSSNLE